MKNDPPRAARLSARGQTDSGGLSDVDAAALLAHRDNVAELLGQALKIAKVVRFEVHAPEAEIDKLRGPMASRNPQFFALEAGIRRSSAA